MKKIFTTTFLSLFLVSQVVLAKDISFTALKGDTTVKAAGAPFSYKAEAGDPLYAGDQIETGSDGLAHIAFSNGAIVLVKENSTLTVEQTPSGRQISFSLGEFLIGLKKKLLPGKKFTVKTPAAVMAVRGTLFWGKTDDEKTSTYACFENSIEITAQGKKIVLTPGQTTTIPFGEQPSVPQQANIPADYVNTFAIDGSLQGLEELMSQTPPIAPPTPTPAPVPDEPAEEKATEEAPTQNTETEELEEEFEEGEEDFEEEEDEEDLDLEEEYEEEPA